VTRPPWAAAIQRVTWVKPEQASKVKMRMPTRLHNGEGHVSGEAIDESWNRFSRRISKDNACGYRPARRGQGSGVASPLLANICMNRFLKHWLCFGVQI
jgi:hypothetical protein